MELVVGLTKADVDVNSLTFNAVDRVRKGTAISTDNLTVIPVGSRWTYQDNDPDSIKLDMLFCTWMHQHNHSTLAYNRDKFIIPNQTFNKVD